jgi:Spy/CpxP family protein refolding chaperone
MSTVSIFGLLVTLAGCSAESSTASSAGTSDTARAQTSASLSQSADGRHMHGPHGHPGPDFLLFAALHEPINLTAEQKATIEGAIAANKPAAPAFDKSKVAALAAGIRAGNVDVSAVKAPNDDAKAARQAASAKALATLHATLTPDQRKALVDALAKRAAEHGAKMDDRDGPRREHAEGPHHGAMGPMGPMGGLLEGLDLTKAQEEAIRTKLEAQRPAAPTDAEREAMKKQHEAFRAEMAAKLQTFATDSFDAAAFVAPPANSMKGPRDHADRFAADLAIITSVLEPAQREKLAARIEAGPPAHGDHGGRAAPGAKR